ncbi:MAG: HlyD family type I secretion periplasmic adaptor subunit, partial [Desulfobacterales bacterium]|nr:HlyD family type I secretion periplasmic adaptor subunit [Desulfobacterales bacterium]
GGIVRQILVRNGDKVEVGQPLILLENARVMAAIDQLNLQLTATLIENARLDAEKELAAAPQWPERSIVVAQVKFDELVKSANKVFTSGRRALKNQTALLEKQIDQLREQEISLDGRLVAEQQIIDALQEELDAKLVLYKDHYIDKTRILELRRALAEHRGIKAQIHGSRAELKERIAEFELRINALDNDYRQQAVTRQSEVAQRIYDLQQQLLPLDDARQRLTVTAPVSGEVVALQVHSAGGVVSPGQPLLDIVPKDSPLIIECRIMVKDITHVFKGQPADVQLLAFSQRTTPKVVGTVVYISADRIMQRTPYGEQPTYVAHIQLDKEELAANDLYLTAGMPAAVYIRTKPRTVLDYALEPLKENFDRALREN